jgi:hypothetical protein
MFVNYNYYNNSVFQADADQLAVKISDFFRYDRAKECTETKATRGGQPQAARVYSPALARVSLVGLLPSRAPLRFAEHQSG